MRKLITALGLAVALSLPVAAQAAPSGTYKFDASHTFVTFQIGRAKAASAHGMLVGGDGTFVYDPSSAGKMKVSFTLPTEAIYTGNKKRDGHLKGPDFFNAKQFPKITFTSTNVKRSGDSYTVTGTLKMHGKSKSQTLNLKKVGEGKNQEGKDYVSFEGTLKLNRKDFGITYLDGYLADSVTIGISADGLKG